MNGLPQSVRLAIIIGAVFVFWVFYDTVFSPVQHHMWADPEMLNVTGWYLIPACYGIIVYFIVRHYGTDAKISAVGNKDNA